jgi:hypothetical protein
VSVARCSELSRAAGEPLGATATAARHWLLVEVRGSWSREVTSPDALSEPARDAVSDWLARMPSSRLLFVRRPVRVGGRALVFVVDAAESTADVRRFELDRLEDLARADLAVGGEPSDVPLVLVCGHGSRDPCCAPRGTAVFGALASKLGEEQVWLSSHQGGHRFAANVLVLPGGLQFGRVEPEEALRVVAAALEGRIALERYRGRSVYERPVQAAELAVRETIGLEGVGDLLFVDAEGGRVRFRDGDGREHVALVAETLGPSVPSSCGAEPEAQATFSAGVV